ncbi:hypothetical protein LOD99_15834 [Oopsacas minuta]|uniref:BZIP domain-containing protein n=1 Tax=Oopsacas minuta TaxID=111878 RepID=A0AAV7KCS6_9METZ|nr:hypothetical protein LOD99_15834 [Oopsacas minuta]
MQATPAQQQKLSVLEDFPLSLTLTNFNTEVAELYNTSVINKNKVADLENKRRLAVHAKNNKRSYYKGKDDMREMADEIEEMIRVRKQLIAEKTALLIEIQKYSMYN